MATRERLRQALADLEAQLHDVESLDPETRAQLLQAANDINARLARHEATPAESAPSAAQSRADSRETATGEIEGSLRERLVDFEASHPQLAMVLTRVIDLLGQAGI